MLCILYIGSTLDQRWVRMSRSILFHSIMAQGKNGVLKASVLHWYIGMHWYGCEVTGITLFR